MTRSCALLLAVAAVLLSACTSSSEEDARVVIDGSLGAVVGGEGWIELDSDNVVDGVAQLEAGSIVKVRATNCPAPMVSFSDPETNNYVQRVFVPEDASFVGSSAPDEPGGERSLDTYLPAEMGLGSIVVFLDCTFVPDVSSESDGEISAFVIDDEVTEIAPRQSIGTLACFQRQDESQYCQTPTVDLPAGTGAG